MDAQNRLAPMKFDYNSDLDILTVEVEGYDDYSGSDELANFVIDFDESGDILGVEIIDASEATPLEKEELKNISEIEFKARRTDEFLEISLLIYIDGNKSVISSNFPVKTGIQA
jgi:uncharacterized protein YuzE